MSVARIDNPDQSHVDVLRETNHRIANHLTLLFGMLQAQASAIGRGPEMMTRENARSMLQEAAGKVMSVSHLHRRLSEGPQQEAIHVCEYLLESTSALIASLALGKRVGVVQHLEADCFVSPDATKSPLRS